MVDGPDVLDPEISAAGDTARHPANSGRDLLRRKYTRLFEIADVNMGGDDTGRDSIELELTPAETGDHDGVRRQALRLSAGLWQIWIEFDGSLSHGPESLSRDDFVRTLVDHLEHRPDRITTFIGQLTNLFFTLSDEDGDERISKDEYMRFGMNFLSCTRAETDEAWAKIDHLQRASVDYPQYLRAVTDFMTSADPLSPGNWIFGRV